MFCLHKYRERLLRDVAMFATRGGVCCCYFRYCRGNGAEIGLFPVDVINGVCPERLVSPGIAFGGGDVFGVIGSVGG